MWTVFSWVRYSTFTHYWWMSLFKVLSFQDISLCPGQRLLAISAFVLASVYWLYLTFYSLIIWIQLIILFSKTPNNKNINKKYGYIIVELIKSNYLYIIIVIYLLWFMSLKYYTFVYWLNWLKQGVGQFAVRFINLLFLFGIRKNCLKTGRSRS